jgi:hypothetical protein
MGSNTEDFTPKFYRFIDSPVMILFFEADDIAITVFSLLFMLIASLVLGFVAGGMIYIYIVAAVGVGAYYRNFKKNKPSGYIFQYFYKKGLYHPSNSMGLEKYKKHSNGYKVVPQYYTKKMKGQ